MKLFLRIFIPLVFILVWVGSVHAQSSILFPPDTTNPTCLGLNNGVIRFSFTGDSTDFFFSWSGGNLPTNGNPVFGDGLVTQTGLRSGDYFVFIQDNTTGFDTTIFISLKNQRTLTVSVGNDINNCLGQPVNLQATSNALPGSIFQWSYTATSGPRTLTGQTTFIPASPSPNAITVSGPVSVLVTDPAGCTATNQLNVTVNIPPTGSASPDTQTICQGLATIALTGSQPGTTFTWTVVRSGVTGATGGFSTTGIISQNLQATIPAVGRVIYNIRPVSPAGCVGPLFTSVVFVRPKPVLTSDPDTADVCSGEQTAFALSSNFANSTFHWIASGVQATGFSSDSGSVIAQTLNTTGSGNGVVRYRVAARSDGCLSDSITLLANVKPIPVLTVLPSDSIAICPGLSQQIDYNSNTPGSLFSWTVIPNGTGAVAGNGNSHNQTYLNSGTTNLKAEFSAIAVANGCTSLVKRHLVNVLPKPVLEAIAANDSICSGDSVNIQLNSTLPNTSFNWTSVSTGVSGNGSGSGSPIKEQLSTTGTAIGSVTYTITGGTPDCPAEAITKTIFVKPRPEVSVLPLRDTLCNGNTSAIALAADIPGSLISWTAQTSGVLGASDGNGSLIAQTLRNQVPGLDSVNYIVTATFRSCSGPSKTAIVLVQRSAAPVPSDSTPEVCSGIPLSIPLSPSSTWNWILQSGSAPGAASGSGTSFEQTILNTGNTDLSLGYLLFGNFGNCPTDTFELPVVIRPLPRLSALLASDSICSGDSARIALSAQPSDNVSFNWIAQAANVLGASDGIGNSILQQLSIASGNSGTVNYRIFSERNGCRDSVDRQIFVSIPDIPVSLDQLDSSICDGDTLIAPLNSTLPGVSYSWTVSAVNVNGAAPGSGNEIRQRLSLADAGLGNGFADYTITPSSGICAGIPKTKRFFVNAVPAAPLISVLAGSSPLCPGDTIVLSSSESTGNQWIRNGVPVLPPAGTAQVITLRDSGNYVVTFTSPEGCSSTSLSQQVDLRFVPAAPVISGPAGFCSGDSARLISSAVSGNQWQLNGLDIPAATDSEFQAKQSGNYTIRLTTSICPVVSNGFTLLEFPNPAVPVISGPSVFCAAGSVTLSSSSTSGNQWFRDGNLLTGQTAPSLITNLAGSYRVSVTDSNNCSAVSDPFSLNADTPPLASVISGQGTKCAGQSVTLTATANLNYQWLRDGLPLTGENQQTLQTTAFGEFRVVVVQGLCSDTSLPFSIIQTPADFTVDTLITNAGCVSGIPVSNGQISISPQGGSGNFRFSWTPASLPALASQSGLAPGQYSVLITDTVSTCQITLDLSLSGPPPVLASAAIENDTRCDIDNGRITITPGGSSGPYGFSWTGRPETVSVIQNLAQGSYEVLITDSSSGCTRLLSDLFIGVPDTVRLSAGLFNQNCASPGRILLQTIGGTGPFGFNWTGDGSGIVTGERNQNALTAGNYQVQVLDSGTQCSRSLSGLQIQFQNTLNLQANRTNPSACNAADGRAVVISGIAAATYRWKNAQGAIVGTDSVLNALQSGTYRALVQTLNCSDSIDVILDNPQLQLQTSTTQISGCEANNGAIQLQIANASGTPLITWTRDGLGFSSQQNISDLSGGVYKVVVEASGCRDSAQVTINPSGAFSFTTQITRPASCSNANGEIKILVTGNTTGLQFRWFRLPGGIGVGGDSSALVNTLPGLYKVRIFNQNCRDSANITLSAQNQIQLDDSLQSPDFCGNANGRIAILDSASLTGQTGEWFSAGNSIGSGFSIGNLGAGSYDFVLRDGPVGAPGTCEQFYNFILNGGTGLGLSAMTDSADCNDGNGKAMIMSNSSAAGLTYTWKKAGNPAFLAFGSEQNNLSSGNYTVVVRNAECIDSVLFSIGKRINCQPCDLPIFIDEQQPGTCFSSDGRLIACVIGAMDNATYLWSDVSTGNILANDDTLRNIPAGTYRVLVNQDACIASLTYTLRKFPPPYSISSSVQDATCANNDGLVTAIISGSLSPNALVNISRVGGGFSIDSVVAPGLSEGEYRISVSDGFCFDSRDQIFVKKPPFCGPCNLQVLTASNPVLCAGASDGEAFAFIESGGFGPFSYSLNGGPAQTKPAFLNSFSNLPAGPFTVVVVDLFSGCSDTVSNVIGTQLTMGVAVETEKPGCDTLGGKILFTIGGATAPYTVILSGDTLFNTRVDTLISPVGDTSFVNITDTSFTTYSDTVVSADGSASFPGVKSGYYQVLVRSSEGCLTRIRNIDMQGIRPVEIIFGDVRPVTCVGSADGSFKIKSLKGSATYTYFINGFSQQILPLDTGMVINGLRKGSFNLRVMGSASCDLDTIITIPGPDSVKVFFGAIQNSICTDSTGSVKIDSIKGGAGAPWNYTITRNSSPYASGVLGSDSLISNLLPGNYQIVFSDSNGCSQQKNFSIQIIRQNVTLDLAVSSNAICEGDTVTFRARTIPAGIPFQWLRNDTIFLSTTDSVLRLTNLKNGEFIRVRVFPDPNCFNQTFLTRTSGPIFVTPQGTTVAAGIQALGSTTICQGSSVTFRGINQNRIPNVKYEWLVDGQLVTGQNDSFFVYTPSFNLTQVKVRITALSGFGCLPVLVDESQPVNVFRIQNDTIRDSIYVVSPADSDLICRKTPVTLALKTNLFGRVPFFVDWYRDDTLRITTTDTLLTLQGLKPGDRIRAVVRFQPFFTCLVTNNGPGSDRSQEITLNLRPSVNDSIRSPSVCGGNDAVVFLHDSARFAGMKVRWYQNEVPLSRNFRLSNVPAGTYQLYVADTINNADCECSFTLNISIPDGSGLGLSARVDSANCLDVGGRVEIRDSLSLSGLTYSWTKAGDSNFSAGGKSQNNLSSGNYSVIVSSASCSDTIAFFVPRANICDTACNLPILIYEVQPGSCASSDGALVACAVGAMDGVSYSWFRMSDTTLIGSDDTLRNIPAGLYRVVVSQDGCLSIKDYQLKKSPVPFAIDTVITNASCSNNDGRLVVSLTGASDSATIQITSISTGLLVSDSLVADSLPSGIYRITVSDGFCSDFVLAEIKKPVFCGPCSLEVVAASNPVYCPGVDDGRAFAIVTSGGFGPYQYILNETDTLNQTQFLQIFPNQPIGPFSVIVQDLTTQCRDTVSGFISSQFTLTAAVATVSNDCDTVGSLSVSLGGVPGPFQVILGGDTLISGNDTIRSSYADTVLVNGSDTVFTRLKAGAYQVKVISAEGCSTRVENILLRLRAPVFARLGKISRVRCAGVTNGSLIIDSLAGSDSYRYFIPGLMTDYQPIQAGDTIKGLPSGTLLLRITGNRSCDLDTSIFIPGPDSLIILPQVLAGSLCSDSAGVVRIAILKGGNGGPYTFTLSRNGNSFAADTLAADSTISGLPPGNYSLTLADSSQCSATAAFRIQSVKLPYQVQLNSDNNLICSGDTISFTASASVPVPGISYQWYLNDSLLSNLSGDSVRLSGLADFDTVFVRAMADSACFAPDSVQSNRLIIRVIGAGSSVLAGILGVDTVVCSGDSARLQALNPANVPDVTYAWLVNGQLQPNQTQDKFAYVPLTGTDTVQVIIRAVSGITCLLAAADTSLPVLVFAAPDLQVKDSLVKTAPGDSTFLCPNTPVSFSLQTNLTVPFVVEWFANSQKVDSSSSRTFTFNGLSGTVKIRAVVKFDTSLTCIDTTGLPGIDSSQVYTLNFLPANDPRCLPCALDLTATLQNLTCASAGDGRITASVTGGTGAYKYKLSPGSSQAVTSPVFSGLLPGTYMLTVRDTITQCVDTLRSLNIVSQNNYAVSLGIENACSCVDSSDAKIEVLSVVDGSSNLNKYLFSLTPGYPQFSSNRIFENLLPDTFLLRVKDTITGCITTITRIITRKPPIDAFLSLKSAVSCFGGSDGKIKLDSIRHGSGLYQVSLTGDPGSYVPVQVGDSLTGFQAGQQVIYIRDLKTGCVDSSLIVVPQPDQLAIGLSLIDTSSCAANTGKVKIGPVIGGTAPYSYLVKYPDSLNFQALVIPPDSILTNLGGGTLMISVTDAKGCLLTGLFNVPVNRPVIDQIRLISPCPGDSNGIIRLSGISGGTSPYTFTLLNNFGQTLASQTDSVFSGLPVGSYTIGIKDATGSNGCENLYSRELLPTQPLRFTLVRFTPSTCDYFDGEAVFALSGGQRPYRYSFDSLAGQFTAFASVDADDTLKLRGLSARIPGAFYTLKIRDNGPSGGCSYDTTFVQPGQAPLQYQFSKKDIRCFGAKTGAVNLTGIQGTGPLVIRVRPVGSTEVVAFDTLRGSFFQNSSFTLGGLAAGEYNLEVKQFGLCDGSRSIPFTISGPDEIRIFARMFRKSAQGFKLGSVLLDSVNGGSKPYLVRFNNELPFTYKADTLFRQLGPGDYQIFVEDDSGCVVERIIQCEEDGKLFIPNLFTPNGSGGNDLFEIRNLPQGAGLIVRDRWGREVFRSGKDGYQNDWDGKDEDDGIYYWQLDIPGGESLSGWVELRR